MKINKGLMFLFTVITVIWGTSALLVMNFPDWAVAYGVETGTYIAGMVIAMTWVLFTGAAIYFFE